jgi:Pentapeptide repeats (8 copies)
MINISPLSYRSRAGNPTNNARLLIDKIRDDAMTPAEILAAIRGRGNLFRLLALTESNPAGSVTLSRMHVLNGFGRRALVSALNQVVHSPMRREGSSRLSEAQQIGFLDLIRKSECERTKRDLFEAGVLTRDDFNHVEMNYIRSDEFLRGWLKTGYVHNDRIESWYSINLTYANFIGAFAGVSPYCVENVDFGDCDMRGASLDGISFNNCNLLYANLEGATMYGGEVKNCKGRGDDDPLLVKQLRDQGLSGLYWRGESLASPERRALSGVPV